ncbi:MAG TPA: MaoC family dehydratase [Pseudolysinimonas sp.]
MNVIAGPEGLASHIGQVLGTGDWLEVSQERIDRFAEATGDLQWLHVDPVRAASGPYGTTIAHGYLVLSLLPALTATAYSVDGATARINYGVDKVRFPSPLPAGSRVRVTSSLESVETVPAGVRAVVHNVVEMEGGAKPVCVADTVSLLIFPSPPEGEK